MKREVNLTGEESTKKSLVGKDKQSEETSSGNISGIEIIRDLMSTESDEENESPTAEKSGGLQHLRDRPILSDVSVK